MCRSRKRRLANTLTFTCLADLDNGIDYQTTPWSNPIPRTSGDRYTAMLTAVIRDSDTTKAVSMADFTYTVP